MLLFNLIYDVINNYFLREIFTKSKSLKIIIFIKILYLILTYSRTH